MAIKRTKSFSPYNYGIIYRKPGQNPFRKYEYVPTASNEPIYVVTKKQVNYFCSIKNLWYYNIDEDGIISFLKCDSKILIGGEMVKPFLKVHDLDSSFPILKYEIKKLNNELYSWINDKTVKIFHNFINGEIDSIILINNEYVDEKCKKKYDNNFIEINFNNINLHSNDKIIVIIYPILLKDFSSELNFLSRSIKIGNIIDDEINDQYLIENLYGSINEKYLIKNNDGEILNSSSFDILPSYISIQKNEILSLDKINSIISYSPKKMKTFIIQKGINNNSITWNNNSVRINHKFNSDINFIIDRNDREKMIKTIKKIDDSNIEITFDNLYNPNVFTIIIFKICD